MAESYGLSQPVGVNAPGLPASLWDTARYFDSEYEETLARALPTNTAHRLKELMLVHTTYWAVWSFLTETELGTIMQAGASKFLPEVTNEKL